MVSDALQKHGIKKQAVQKVMDTMAANGKITFKDYGKQRVCLANQSQFEIPDIDELDAMKKQNDQLQADVVSVRSHVAELEAGMSKHPGLRILQTLPFNHLPFGFWNGFQCGST